MTDLIDPHIPPMHRNKRTKLIQLPGLVEIRAKADERSEGATFNDAIISYRLYSSSPNIGDENNVYQMSADEWFGWYDFGGIKFLEEVSITPVDSAPEFSIPSSWIPVKRTLELLRHRSSEPYGLYDAMYSYSITSRVIDTRDIRANEFLFASSRSYTLGFRYVHAQDPNLMHKIIEGFRKNASQPASGIYWTALLDYARAYSDVATWRAASSDLNVDDVASYVYAGVSDIEVISNLVKNNVDVELGLSL